MCPSQKTTCAPPGWKLRSPRWGRSCSPTTGRTAAPERRAVVVDAPGDAERTVRLRPAIYLPRPADRVRVRHGHRLVPADVFPDGDRVARPVRDRDDGLF